MLSGILCDVGDGRRIAAGGLTHAGINGVTGLGEGAGGERAKAARCAGDDNNVFHDTYSFEWFLRVLAFGSDQPAIGAQHLGVDPAAFRTDQEGNDIGDVLGCAEALHWRRLGETLDQLR